MSEKKVYFNKPQCLTQLIGANTIVIVAGRRTGKTDSIAAPFVLRNMQVQPSATAGNHHKNSLPKLNCTPKVGHKTFGVRYE